MGQKIVNGAWGTLAAGINGSDTTINLTTGHGARFGSFSAGDYLYCTLIKTSTNEVEYIRVTAIATDALTVVRAQDGSTGIAFSAGDRIECRPIAAAVFDIRRRHVTAKTAGFTVGVADLGKTFSCSNSITVAFAAAATLADGFSCEIRNDGAGVVTLDPDSSETIDGGATLPLFPGDSCSVVCDGTSLRTFGLGPRVIHRLTGDTEIASALSGDLLNFTVPANLLKTNRRLNVRAYGDFLANTGVAQTLRMQASYNSGASVLDTGAVGWADNPSRRPWMLEIDIIGDGATNAQFFHSTWKGGFPGASGGSMSTTQGDFVTTQEGTIATDSTLDRTLNINVALSAAHASLLSRIRAAQITLF